MTDELKLKMMENLLKNARVGQLNMVVESGATVNYYESREKEKATHFEDDVKRAVLRLMEEKDEDGNYIVFEQGQFYAIKAVLTSPRCGFPTKPADFGKVMRNLELDNLRVRYDYESIRKIHPHQLPQNVELWHQFMNTTDDYSLKQVRPAVRLMKLIEEERQ